ncbi:hypothetical protein MMC11_002398 [Xylographa trunciseda]|nr:hypothetical protein [Xylographa trunciseda]
MEALPVPERTELEYASTKIMKDPEGKDVPVMHACGHDMHVATLMAASTLLHSARSHWSGTLICLFQPNEEFAAGAQAMVDDELYQRFGIPVPDIVLGQHVLNPKTGTIDFASGPVLAAVDSVEIRVFGKGGHGTRPDRAVDPIVTAAHIVTRLQSIVSREVAPKDTAMVSCGSFHGGDAANVIPDFVDLKLTVRSYRPQVQERLLSAVQRIVWAESQASGAVAEPTFESLMHGPSTINDSKKYEVLSPAVQAYFKDNALSMDPLPGSEDFSVLATACNAPYLYWIYGGIDAAHWEEAEKQDRLGDFPYNHSPLFAPVIQPTMSTAVDAFALAALTFFV